MSTINREAAIAELMKMPKPLVHWEQVKKMLEAMPDVPDTNVGDTIYRQAAIDALKDLEFCHYIEFGEYIGENTKEVRLIRAEKAQNALQNLPSAQPEQICVIKVTATDEQVQEAFEKAKAQMKLMMFPSAQLETAKRIVGKSRDGMTLWYQCDICNESVDAQDVFCRGCGRRLIDG